VTLKRTRLSKRSKSTRSRGGAFGAGYTDALLELIKNNAAQFASPNNVIDYILSLATHQSNFIDAPNGKNH
jgi:hypothetical protein